MAAHARLSPSSAHRWLNCPPSVRLSEGIPDTGSVYAREGTLAHSLAELELRKALKMVTPAKYKKELNAIKAHELYTEEMPDYIELYKDFVLERLAEAKSRTKDPVVNLEERLDFSDWVQEGFGTGDCIIVSDDYLEIIDFKYGKGVEVSAEENDQMKIYALGGLNYYNLSYDFDRIRLSIVQPRLGNITSSEVEVRDLLRWADVELKPRAKMAWDGEGETRAGDWCKFCKVGATCKARAETPLRLYEDFDLQKPELLSNEEIAKILEVADSVQAWAKDIKEYALLQALDHGVEFEGWKLVEGRSNRKFTDEAAVEAELKAYGLSEEEIFNIKLKGITELEKAVGKKKFNELLASYIEKPPGKPTLVVVTDKRPVLDTTTINKDFDIN